MLNTRNQDQLKAFISRRHPLYYENLSFWTLAAATYRGGSAWFYGNIFTYLKEGESEYTQRVMRAYRFNHTREVVDLVNKYIFKANIHRNEEDTPQEIKDFWLDATLNGLDIKQFMAVVSRKASLFGLVWIVTDSNATEDIVSRADAKASKRKAYAYTKDPGDVLDYSLDEFGQLNWIKFLEHHRDDEDPIKSSGDTSLRYRIITREDYAVYEEIDAGQRGKIVKRIEHGEHSLKRVPCFAVAHTVGETEYAPPGLVSDIVYLDRAVANYLSNLDAIIQDQTFSQLAMPAQGLMKGDDAHEKLVEMGTKRIFLFDGEGNAKPEYLSPDPKQAGVILTVINKIISEIYHTIGASGERTKQDNAVGTDNSSGVAKAYDFERVNSLLSAKAQSLENAENHLVEMILQWYSKPKPPKELVKYPETFDVRSLFDEFTIAERLLLVEAPPEVRREQMMQVVDKLFPRIAEDVKAAIKKDVDKWLENMPLDPNAPPTSFAPTKKLAAKNPQTANRQGQA